MAALPQLYPFKAGPIEPIVMPGEIVGIWIAKQYEFFKVEFIEGVPRSDPLVQNCGAVAAAATSVLTQLALLELPTLEFGQFRSFALDDAAFNVFQGRSDQRHKLRNVNGRITRFTDQRDPCGHGTEIFVYVQEDAFVSALNTTGYALAQTRIGFYGFRYVLKEEKGYDYNKGVLPANWTRVPATAHL